MAIFSLVLQSRDNVICKNAALSLVRIFSPLLDFNQNSCIYYVHNFYPYLYVDEIWRWLFRTQISQIPPDVIYNEIIVQNRVLQDVVNSSCVKTQCVRV